jgi:hypothetical protein
MELFSKLPKHIKQTSEHFTSIEHSSGKYDFFVSAGRVDKVNDCVKIRILSGSPGNKKYSYCTVTNELLREDIASDILIEEHLQVINILLSEVKKLKVVNGC